MATEYVFDADAMKFNSFISMVVYFTNGNDFEIGDRFTIQNVGIYIRNFDIDYSKNYRIEDCVFLIKDDYDEIYNYTYDYYYFDEITFYFE